MRAFLAMIWNDEDGKARRAAVRMKAQIEASARSSDHVVNGTGIVLSDLSEGPVPLLIPITGAGGQTEGAVFGTLFSRSMAHGRHPRVRKISGARSAALTRSAGADLIADYWGRYIAVLRTPRGAVLLADPTSAIPCFWTRSCGVTLAFSHLEHCRLLDLSTLGINFNFVSALLAYDKIQNGQTGINEISELIGGQRLHIRSGYCEAETLWDPRKIAARPLKLSPPDAASELKATTCAVIESWTACYDRLIVNASGGLDSSIVLAAACKGMPSRRITAVHSVLDAGDSPESQFARYAAELAGCNYRETFTAARRGLPDIESHPATARPYRQFLAPDLPSDAGGEAPAPDEAIFTGQGGDHLFHVSRNPMIFADFLRIDANPARFAGELFNASRLSGRSIWSVLALALPGAVLPARNLTVTRAISLRRTPINSSAHERIDAADLLPPWTREARGLPPAKFDQINSLPHLFQVRRPLDRAGARDVIHPLISQPLIELCLRLPAYTLCAGGRSRGLARAAFEGDVPDEILRRMTKGSASRHYMNHVGLHAGQLAETLAGGALADAGLVDPDTVRAFIRTQDFRNDLSGHMVLVYYAIEAWLRTWRRNIPRRSSAG